MSDSPTPQAAPRWDAPELGVRTFRMVLLYFERTFGRARLEQVWAETALPLPLSYAEDLSGFVSLAFVERLFDALVEASGDPDFLSKAGRHSASPEALGFPYYLLRGVGSPALVYQKTIELGPVFNRVGQFVVEELAANSLILKYTSRVPERNRNLCLCRVGTFAAFPRIWGLPEAEVVETQCQVLGANCCRYRVARTSSGGLAAVGLSG